MFHRLFHVTMITVLGVSIWAADPPTKDSKSDNPPSKDKASGTAIKSDKNEPAVFELRMHDDSVMKVTLLESSVSVATKYGKLSVPTTELRKLEFGFRYPEGVEAKIDAAISDLGSPEFRTREDAEQRLADIGHFAIPALQRARKGQEPEVVRRAAAVLKLLEGKQGDNKTELRDFDVIETAEFTMKGRLEVGALKVRTKYFGETTVKFADIKSFRSIGSASASEFTLDAGKYAKMNQADWFETQIEVTSGQQLEVSASGKIDQWPQGAGQYMSEPGGPPGQAPGQFLPTGMPRIGIPGQIVARIGSNGTPFALGASYKGKVNDSGRLYVRISPSPWNCDSTGSYKVTVNVTSP